MSSARRARSSWARLISPSRPAGRESRTDLGIVIRLSQLMTESSGNPSSGPTWTSDLIPLIVRVIGTHVTEGRTEAAAFRVTTQTGRLPEGGPRSAQQISFRAINYQGGPVRAARRAADRSNAGSGGRRRYAAMSSRSAAARSSASITTRAPRRRSSERFVPRDEAIRSRSRTRSSSNCTSTSRRAMTIW